MDARRPLWPAHGGGAQRDHHGVVIRDLCLSAFLLVIPRPGDAELLALDHSDRDNPGVAPQPPCRAIPRVVPLAVARHAQCVAWVAPRPDSSPYVH